MLRYRIVSLLGICSFLAGCATHRDAGWQPRRPLGADLPTYQPPLKAAPASQPSSPPEEPAGAITLRQALALALLHNPDLASASWDVRIGEARRIQAGLPPNPEIAFDMDIINPISAAERTLQLGQVIFLTAKRQRQVKVAALERDLAGWDYEAARISVFTQTAKAFVALRAAQEKLSLAEEIVGLSRKMADTAGERVRSGKAAPLEEMKAKVELGRVRMELEGARQAAPAGRKRLAALWGCTNPVFERAEADFDVAPTIPSAEQLVGLLSQNPEVARWATELELRRATLRLEKAKAIPDLALAGGWKHEGETGRDGGVASAAIPLPIFDRNQGNIRHAEYDASKGREQRRAAESRAYGELAEAYRLLATAHAKATILKNDVLPEAQKAFDASLEGYRQGKFAYLDVLDAQRTLFDAKGEFVDAVANYHTAATDVEGLTGQRLDFMGTDGSNLQEKE
jgi:outer membrane protein, heavy metal efflux system